ncbi:MAG: FtsQ-type POTRA domain-containing protein [Candidatus Omnitrophica bacterium]|nr:FtsQ-type POTRA domain-containing protein [Candidatus Omnitrophota bacterium]
MGRKNKKGKRGGFFRGLGAVLRALGWVIWKLVPVLLIAVLTLMIGLEVRKVLMRDSFLQVREIKVVPPEVLSDQSVRALESKVLGRNILTLDLRRIEQQIELGPSAQSVRVVREIPATVRIEIKKRDPVANVQLKPKGPYAVVADDGYMIEIRSDPDPAWVVMEDHGDAVKEPRVGLRVQNRGFFEALRFMTLFRKHELSRRETVTKIVLDPYGNVTVRLGEGPDFQLGRKPAERISFLTKALYLFHTEPREAIEYLDLQYDRIAVKRKS